MNAVNRFDVDNGAEFVAFAVPTIMGEVRRHFRDHGWSVKVPRRLKELNAQLKRCREELSHELGRAPTASEIATKLGIDREEVVQAQIASSAYSTLSSDAPAGAGDDDDGRSVTNTFGDLDANLDKVLDVATVRPLLAALPERERTVLTLRFFENMTQTQIAERVGISQMHVSRLLARSLGTLRRQVRDTGTGLSPKHAADGHEVWPCRRGVIDGCELKPPNAHGGPRFTTRASWSADHLVAMDRSTQNHRTLPSESSINAIEEAQMSEQDKSGQARKGLIDSVKGKAKEVVGAMTGNDSLTAEGQLEQTQAKERKEANSVEAVADAEADQARAEVTEAQVEGARAADRGERRDKGRGEHRARRPSRTEARSRTSSATGCRAGEDAGRTRRTARGAAGERRGARRDRRRDRGGR